MVQIQYNDKYNSLSTEYQNLLNKFQEKENENEGKVLVPSNEYNELKVLIYIYIIYIFKNRNFHLN